MSKYLLEVCVDSVESALAAKDAGADRLELCSNLIIGGTTPSEALFHEIRKHTDIRMHALIRPRFGDFCYTEYEFEIIKEEVKRYRELGIEGVVIGILTQDGVLDMKRMDQLMQEAEGMSVTLHRAFDVCRDPFEGLEMACNLGIHTILTSGQQNNCMAGKELLAKLKAKAEGKIDIMAGSGVEASVIEPIARETGIKSFHMSGKITKNSEMIYRKEGVNMGLPSISEFEIWRTDEKKIKEAKDILYKLEEEDVSAGK